MKPSEGQCKSNISILHTVHSEAQDMAWKVQFPSLVYLANAVINKGHCLLITIMKLLHAACSTKVINELKNFWTMNASETHEQFFSAKVLEECRFKWI